MSKTKYNIRSTKDISDLILLWPLLCGHLTWGVGCPWALSPLQWSLCLLSSFMQAAGLSPEPLSSPLNVPVVCSFPTVHWFLNFSVVMSHLACLIKWTFPGALQGFWWSRSEMWPPNLHLDKPPRWFCCRGAKDPASRSTKKSLGKWLLSGAFYLNNTAMKIW